MATLKDGEEAPVAVSSLVEGASIADAIRGILEEFEVQPVLFVGSGIARRYIGAPDWEAALKIGLAAMGDDARSYSYYAQKYGDDKISIGTAIADEIFEWAWDKGRDQFDPSLFDSTDRHIFLKSIIADHLSEITPQALNNLSEEHAKEFSAIQAIKPHAIITTNYDGLLELVFEGYEPIVGKSVLRYDLNSFGEIFHIHGMASDPASLTLTAPDYVNWHKQSRYFAAKLLTYFAEHPVFIFGYGLGDPNVRTLLQDIGRISADAKGLVPNVVQVVWHSELKSGPSQSEVVIDDEDDGRQYRLRVFNVTSLYEVFNLLAVTHELKKVNPALLRAMAARLMKLARKDIPGGTIEVDYGTLEKYTQEDDALPKMLGLTFADSDNKTHPFTLSQIADELHLPGWQHVQPLIKRVEDEKGVNLRASDNRYHERIKTGKSASSAVRKWSHEAVDLFKAVLDGKDYDVKE